MLLESWVSNCSDSFLADSVEAMDSSSIWAALFLISSAALTDSDVSPARVVMEALTSSAEALTSSVAAEEDVVASLIFSMYSLMASNLSLSSAEAFSRSMDDRDIFSEWSAMLPIISRLLPYMAFRAEPIFPSSSLDLTFSWSMVRSPAARPSENC